MSSVISSTTEKEMTLRLIVKSALMIGTSLLMSCGTVSYLKSEVSGDAKPTGGTTEVIPVTKSYQAQPAAIRSEVLTILSDQGYIYDENKSTGAIRTEPKLLSNAGGMMVEYSARVFVTLEATSVTYRARFDKKSSITQGGNNLEFPEKENDLRKEFFAALDKKLTPKGEHSQNRVLVPTSPPTPSATPQSAQSTSVPQNAPQDGMAIAEMQKILLGLGYQPGPADGVNGKRTVDALKKFQKANQLPATGVLDADTVTRLRSAKR